MNRIASWLYAMSFTTAAMLANPAYAKDGLSAGLGLFYFSEGGATRQNDGSTLKTTHEYTFLDAFLFYQLQYLVAGVKYLTGTVDTTASSSSAGKSTVTENYKGLGLSLGLKGEQAMLTYTYLLNPEKVYGDNLTSDLSASSGGKTTYYGKYAHVIDAAYGFPVSSFFVGPMLSLVHFEFNKIKSPGVSRHDLRPAQDADFVIPHVAAWMEF